MSALLPRPSARAVKRHWRIVDALRVFPSRALHRIRGLENKTSPGSDGSQPAVTELWCAGISHGLSQR
jgi:hypothetical protein